MKLALIWYWDRAAEIYPNWRDGLRAALEELQKRGHTVNIYRGEEVPQLQGEDAMLVWGDSNCPLLPQLGQFTCRKGLQLTTWPQNIDNLRNLDVIFCESVSIYEYVKARGFHAILGFGTDTNFFKPDESKPKDIPYFYPATFSPWKRQDLIKDLGAKLFCLGTVQPDGERIWDACEKAGVHLLAGYFPPTTVLDCYQRSQQVLIPAVHGSERTVLEAMSCNILPHVVGDNSRAQSYIDQFKGWLATHGKWTRDFVIERYSEKTYANALEKGLLSEV